MQSAFNRGQARADSTASGIMIIKMHLSGPPMTSRAGMLDMAFGSNSRDVGLRRSGLLAHFRFGTSG